MAMDATELGRWMRFAAKGGIGKCVAVRDCEALEIGDLMFLEGDEIIVLHQLPSPSSNSNDTPDISSPSSNTNLQFLGYCEEIVGRFNARDVRFTTKLKKAVMTKRASSSSGVGPSPATPTTTSSPSNAPGIAASTSGSSITTSSSTSSASPNGITNSARASPAPSTLSTASSSTLGVHEPRGSPSLSSSVAKSGLAGLGLGINGGVGLDSVERRSSAATSSTNTPSTRTASPLQRSFTSPPPSTSTSTSSSSLSVHGASTSTLSDASFVSFSPTPSSTSATPSPREASFPSSISGSSFGADRTLPLRSVSASASSRSNPTRTSPALQHSRSLGSTSSSTSSYSTSSSPPPSSATSPTLSSSTLPAHQQHRYTAHAPSPLSFASAGALSHTSTPSLSSYSRSSRSSSGNGSLTGTPTSPAFSATGTLSPSSPSFSSNTFSGTSNLNTRDGLTPTTGTTPLRITKRSPSLGHSAAHGYSGGVIPGLRSPPPASPLPEVPVTPSGSSTMGQAQRNTPLPAEVGVTGSLEVLQEELEMKSASSSTSPPTSSNLISNLTSTSNSSAMPLATSPSTGTLSSSLPSASSAPSSSPATSTFVSRPPPALDLPSIADPIPPSPISAPHSSATTNSAGESPMSSAYAARMAFTPLPSSVGGFGVLSGVVGQGMKDAVSATPDVHPITQVVLPAPTAPAPSTISTTISSIPSPPANDIGLSLLQLQDLADGMYSYGSDSDSDSQYSDHSDDRDIVRTPNGSGGFGSRAGSGMGSRSGSAFGSRSTSRAEGKVVEGVGVVDRNGRRKSVVPASGSTGSAGRRATLRASTFGGLEKGVSSSPSPSLSQDSRSRLEERQDVLEEDDVGSEDGTVEGPAYYSLGGDAAGDDDEDSKALLAKMEAMNAMVAAMPAFPTKPSPGVVARSALPPSVANTSSSSSPGPVPVQGQGSAPFPTASSSSGSSNKPSSSHLSPTSPTFPSPTFPSKTPNFDTHAQAQERERRPSMMSAYSAQSVHSVHSVQSGKSGKSAMSGASGMTSGSGEDYDIYDSYRYSRYSVLSGRSGGSVGQGQMGMGGGMGMTGSGSVSGSVSGLSLRAGGKRMDSMGSVDESYESERNGMGPRVRGLDMVLDELSYGDEESRTANETVSVGAGPGASQAHDRTMSIDSEASVYTQDSSERAKEAVDTVPLGASTGSNESGTSTAAGAHTTTSISATSSTPTGARPAPLDLTKKSSVPGAKSVTSPLLHTSWGSAASSSKSSAAPFDINGASFGGQVQSLVGALNVERSGEVKSARAEVEERMDVRQGCGDLQDGDRSVSTIVDGAGLGQQIVVEDDEELPSRIEDDGSGLDDTMTSMNSKRSGSGSPEPVLAGLAPSLVITNRTPTPGGDDAADMVPLPAAVPRPPRTAGLSPFAASNQRRSLFMPHPGAPKAPSQVESEAAGASSEPAARLASPPLHGAHPNAHLQQRPMTNSPPVPTLRLSVYQTINMSLSTPPRPPPPVLQGMRPPPAPLMRGPTIYGRTDLDLSTSDRPVPISWSIDPFPVLVKKASSGNVQGGKGAAPQGQALPPVGVGRGYPTRSMSTGSQLGAGAAPSTSSPLAKSASMAASTSPPPPANQPSVSASKPPMLATSPPPLDQAAARPGAVLPRANFVPQAPGLRPRSRSFSGFNSTTKESSRPNDVPVSRSPLSISSPTLPGPESPVASISPASSSTTLTVSSSIGSASSQTTVASSTSISSSSSTPTSKPPIPTAPKPTPKPGPSLSSKKPSSLSLRSSPLSTSLSVGGGLKSPKAPTSPLAMNMVVAQRDSVASISETDKDGGKGAEKGGPDPRQLRLRAMGSMPNLAASSRGSFSPTLSPPPKSPSPLSIGAPVITTSKSESTSPSVIATSAKDDLMDAEVMSMSSNTPGRLKSPPPFSSLPLLVPPPSHQSHSQGPSSPSLSPHRSPISPATQQPMVFPPHDQARETGGAARPQRQNSLRSKLSLPNLRRKHSRPEDDDLERDHSRPLHESHGLRRDTRDREDALDLERERELLQVRDMEFELVRPTLPAAQREWGAARTSEDSGVLGRDTSSFDFSGPGAGHGPFRGSAGTNSRGSVDSRGSFEVASIHGGGSIANSGLSSEGSRLRPTSPAFSVVSGAPSSHSLSRQRSPTLDGPWSSQSDSPTSLAAQSPADIEAHRAREQRWLSLLSSVPSSGVAAYTLPVSSSQSSSNTSPVIPSNYTPNPIAKSRKTRKLLLESPVPSSVRFRVWVFLTDARARAVPGVYNALVKRGVGRVNEDTVERMRSDVRSHWERLASRPRSPSLASRSSMAHLDDGSEDKAISAAKPFTAPNGGDAPVSTLLLAYLNMVPDVSYSRGLVSVLGHLLVLSPDEDAFWIFVSVMDSWLRGYFVALPSWTSPKLGSQPSVAPQMEVDALLFTRALEANEPQVAKRLLVDVGVSGADICGQWLTSVFVGTLPGDHLNRVWDIFLFEGIPFLIRVGIALVSCLKRQLLTPLPLASSILASSSGPNSSSQSPHAASLLSLLHAPPSGSLPPMPDTFITMALNVKLKDDDVRKQRTKMEQQISLKIRQQQAPSSAGQIRGSFQSLRAGGSTISLPRAAT